MPIVSNGLLNSRLDSLSRTARVSTQRRHWSGRSCAGSRREAHQASTSVSRRTWPRNSCSQFREPHASTRNRVLFFAELSSLANTIQAARRWISLASRSSVVYSETTQFLKQLFFSCSDSANHLVHCSNWDLGYDGLPVRWLRLPPTDWKSVVQVNLNTNSSLEQSTSTA